MEPNALAVRLYSVEIASTKLMPEVESDGTTFRDTYVAQWQQMVRFAALTTGSVALAEEIVQDAFVDLSRRWANVANPRAYLRCAVSSRCTSWVRRQKLERRVPADARPFHLDESLVELVDAMKVLSRRQRVAIVLRYLEDLSESEIAITLSCKPGTVKSLLARALARLRKELE